MRKTAHPATTYLAKIDSDWAALVKRVGPCGLQTMPKREPYEALIRAIAHQQLHGKAAEAILGRFVAMYPGEAFPSPASILNTEPELLRACGFSFAKIASIRGIAEGSAAGVVPTGKASKKLSDEELIERLVTLKGVGRWTVEMLLIHTLERPDILPVDDFGVREGWRVLKSLPQQPKPRELARIGLDWSPHRSAAAWYLWRAAEQAKLPAV
ncbi:DNA-3-methyladenine glycosylase 2 family protein [Undibacterium sp.]|uniref:DNA-3-methyladenine glycosylase family protein n=1 Tax=Undibacterium sp. TaxID=1914977 RepID=UPI002B9A9C70|nr:DNA-3-methyladenine glycosylase 2 family protein [Undibacterium sp.]HTD06746.1 DNA-3-methyladenine glycosylase 2 family protein [Undibacterium sp.]